MSGVWSGIFMTVLLLAPSYYPFPIVPTPVSRLHFVCSASIPLRLIPCSILDLALLMHSIMPVPLQHFPPPGYRSVSRPPASGFGIRSIRMPILYLEPATNKTEGLLFGFRSCILRSLMKGNFKLGVRALSLLCEAITGSPNQAKPLVVQPYYHHHLCSPLTNFLFAVSRSGFSRWQSSSHLQGTASTGNFPSLSRYALTTPFHALYVAVLRLC